MHITTKGTLIGAAAALVVSTVLVAGLTTSVTAGAGTDTVPVSTATPTTAPSTPTAVPTVVPVSTPIAVATAPAAVPTNPNGGQLGVNKGPVGGLPNTGYGTTTGRSHSSELALLGLLALAGVAVAGAGMAAASKRRG